MFFDLLFQFLEPSQIGTSIAVAVGSIVLRHAIMLILPALLSFLANLAVLIILFVIFVLSLFTFASLPPLP